MASDWMMGFVIGGPGRWALEAVRMRRRHETFHDIADRPQNPARIVERIERVAPTWRAGTHEQPSLPLGSFYLPNAELSRTCARNAMARSLLAIGAVEPVLQIAAGSEIRPYRLVALVGRGGMGEVWPAEHAILGRRAAMKVLPNQFSRLQDIVTRFRTKSSERAMLLSGSVASSIQRR